MSTAPAKLPALPPVTTDNVQLQRWMQAVSERLEVREGARGNQDERVVLQRDLKALGLASTQFVGSRITPSSNAGGGVLVQTPGGGFTRIPIDAFSDELRKTRLYRDLLARIDDTARFDELPDQVRSLLLRPIADEAEQRGAEVRRLDRKLQNATESLAYSVQEVTTAVSGAQAGVREVAFASTTANAAIAGRVTQVQARLDDFSDGTAGSATIEEKMTASASRANGLSAQYTLKVGTGNKIAGVGLASTTSTAGAGTSAIILQADKFALVGSAETIADPANPPISRVPFGYDSATNTIYINGQVRINAGGSRLDAIGATGPAGAAGARGSVTRYGTGAWSDATAVALLPSAAVVGDTVTLVNGSSAVTKYWGGSAWLSPGVIIDGNLLVGGTISSTSLDTSGYVKAGGSSLAAGITAAGHFNVSMSAPYGATAYGTSCGLYGSSSGTGIGVFGQSVNGVGVYGSTSGGLAPAVYGQSLQGVAGRGIETNGTCNIGGQLTLSVPTGTAPISATSSTQCPGLNASMVGGYPAINLVRTTPSFTVDSLTTGGSSVSFPGNNKPGSTSGAANTWLAVTIGGAQYAIPAWAF